MEVKGVDLNLKDVINASNGNFIMPLRRRKCKLVMRTK